MQLYFLFFLQLFKGLIGCDEECANGGICYDGGKCSCSPDYYGDKCQYKTGKYGVLNVETFNKCLVWNSFWDVKITFFLFIWDTALMFRVSVEMKNKKYHNGGTVPKSNKIKSCKETKSILIYDCSLSWLGTGTSIKSGGLN